METVWYRFCRNANGFCHYVNEWSAVTELLDLACTAGRQGQLSKPSKIFYIRGSDKIINIFDGVRFSVDEISILRSSLVSRTRSKAVSEGPVIRAPSNDRPQGRALSCGSAAIAIYCIVVCADFPSSTGYISLSKTRLNESSSKLTVCCVKYQNRGLVELHSFWQNTQIGPDWPSARPAMR